MMGSGIKGFSIAAVTACILPLPASAQNADHLHLSCTQAVTKGTIARKSGLIHFRIGPNDLERFDESSNVFFSRCNTSPSYRCTIAIKEATITHKALLTFKSLDGSGRDVFYETTIHISRYTGEYGEWTHELDSGGRVVSPFTSSVSGICTQEDSPEMTRRRF